MIDRSIFKPYLSSLVVGVQIHIDHTGCSAGKDTKKRLYIKRVVGGVVGYCHHCNEAGFQRELNTDGTALRKWVMGKTDHESPRVIISTLGPALSDITDEHLSLSVWLKKHYISPWISKADNEYFKQDHYENLVLPLNNFRNNRYGYQTRSFHGGPKYVTRITDPCGCDVSWWLGRLDKLCITEDYTSAYRIWRDTGISSVALLKTTLAEPTLANIRGLPLDTIIIWLDSDDAGISARNKIARRISFALHGPVVRTVNNPEPKTYSPTELRSICEKY